MEGDYETHSFSIESKGKREYIKIESKDRGSGMSMPIPNAHDNVFKKIYIELASVDDALFESASKAYSGVAEVEHIRASLITNATSNDENLPDPLRSFAPYAQETLKSASDSIAALYKECTGRELTTHKIRTYV